jgi:hypothetical protein
LLAKRPRDFEAHLRLAQIFLARYRSKEDSGEDKSSFLKKARSHAAEAAAMRPADPQVKALLTRLKAR